MEQGTHPGLARTILRLVQTHGSIERSKLGLQSRSYDPENWPNVLDELVNRGLITEGSEIRVGEKSYRGNKRAVIVYTLTHPDDHPTFAVMSAEEVQAYISKYPVMHSVAQ